MEFGKINSSEIITAVIMTSGVFVIICDILRGKIYNWFTLPLAVLGLILAIATSVHQQAFGNALNALAGCLAGLIIYGWIFRLGVMGGGDVKYLMALGTWGGFYYTVEVAVLAILVGGVFSLGILVFKKRAFDFSFRLFRYLRSIFLKQLEVETFKVDRTLTMPFGIPLGIASIWAWLAHPLKLFY